MITCSNCKTENLDNAKFCLECATSLREAPAPQSSAQVQNGALARGNDNLVVGQDGVGVGGNVGGHVIVVKEGGQVVIGKQPVTMTAVDRQRALGRYLEHVIAHNRYLQLQGIGSGGKLVNVELEHIYITLRATRTRQAEEAWLAEESRLAPGEAMKGEALNHERPLSNETITVNVQKVRSLSDRLQQRLGAVHVTLPANIMAERGPDENV